MNLDEARQGIDDIDNQILQLFEKRMQISDEIARIKMESGMTILNMDRERQIIDRVRASVNPEYAEYSAAMFNVIMTISRGRQREIICSAECGSRRFNSIISNTRDEISAPRVAVQGVQGSYASIAARKMYKGCKISNVDKWEDVLCCIQNGTADYGVLPVENSAAGSVIDVYDLLLKYKYNIVKAYDLPVSHCLLGVRGASLKNIREVYTHPHAFPQCNSFLEKHCYMKKMPHYNTAMAAEYVAKAGNTSKAAIASKECAHMFGLDILAENIQEYSDNCTRFVSVSKHCEIHEGAGKISLVFSLPHVTGSLYRTLARFASIGCNLTKIESRPDKSRPFEYYFYIDLIGNIKNTRTLTLLGALNDELPSFHFLGNYDEIVENNSRCLQ